MFSRPARLYMLAESIPGLLKRDMAMRRIFWGFCRKLVPQRSLALPFEPFRFRLRIRGDNRKTTPRLGESATRGVAEKKTANYETSYNKKIYFASL
jgi:hypothetical protein